MSSPPGPDAEAIRNKRLARMQAFQRPAASPSSDEKPAEGSSSFETRDEKPEPRIAELPKPTPPPPTASATPPAKPSPSPAPPAVVHAAPPRQITIKPFPETPNPPGLSPQEAWEDKVLGQIFKVSLTPNPRTKSGESMLLDDLRAEQEAEMQDSDVKKSPYISLGLLDQLILSVCAAPKIVPIDYLVGCWLRVSNIQRSTPNTRLDDAKLEVLREARRLCVGYTLYCITMPDMFEGKQPPVRLEKRLLADVDDPEGLPQDLLLELIARYDEEPDLVDHVSNAMKALSAELSMLSITDNYKPYVFALSRLVGVKVLAEQYTALPEFLPSTHPKTPTAERIERKTLLGPYLRISPLQKQSAQLYFLGAKTKGPATISTAINAMRLSIRSHQDQMHDIIKALVRASDKSRNKMLDYFAEVINMNRKRGAMQVDPRTVASDGFMLNITTILTKLCEPFMDHTFTKLDKIQFNYFSQTPRLDITEETKLNSDEQTTKEYYSKQQPRNTNFITEVFYLTIAAHHYGLVATEKTYETLCRDLPELEKNLEMIEKDRPKYVGTPNQLVFDRHVEAIRKRIDEGYAQKNAIQVVIFDDLLQSRSMIFIRYLTTWLLRVVDPKHSYPTSSIELPLPDAPPELFNHFPEYFVEDIGEVVSFVTHWLPNCVLVASLDELLVFCLTFLRSSTYVRTPSLKSKLVEIIYTGLQAYPGKPNGYLGDLIHGNPFVLKNLMHSLMSFYIDIEKQYYEKFTVRYHIAWIIKSVWVNQQYRDKLEQESKHNVDFFVRFVALLLNDATYVLDNALTPLADIRKLQDELSSPEEGLTPEARAEKEKALVKKEKEAKSYMQLSNETVTMLRLFTSAIVDAFVQPEIVSRLASMLDYNLEAITGPRCRDLKVREPEKYHFRPKELLAELVDVYLNLGPRTPFVEAIARDGRSYKPELFENALRVLERTQMKSEQELAALKKLADKVKETKELEDLAEMDLGEIPDEFLDPLLATLMEDPVILPSSRVTIDRQTIKSHLLSDPKDPFNRAPLKIEDVVPDVEKKTQIDAWVAEQRQKALAARSAAAPATGGEAMDVDG